MSPLPCPDLHPALLQSIPALQPVETTVSKFINKEWASEASPMALLVIIIAIHCKKWGVHSTPKPLHTYSVKAHLQLVVCIAHQISGVHIFWYDMHTKIQSQCA